ncbi:hypothetical protein BDY24DRAFT_444972, partial [Mrakia frigida]|uniref:uncharacterized protein n=1 Tax=Mrakia frigida TaxID=29902 RepID=UPI003FCC0359
ASEIENGLSSRTSPPFSPLLRRPIFSTFLLTFLPHFLISACSPCLSSYLERTSRPGEASFKGWDSLFARDPFYLKLDTISLWTTRNISSTF